MFATIYELASLIKIYNNSNVIANIMQYYLLFIYYWHLFVYGVSIELLILVATIRISIPSLPKTSKDVPRVCRTALQMIGLYFHNKFKLRVLHYPAYVWEMRLCVMKVMIHLLKLWWRTLIFPKLIIFPIMEIHCNKILFPPWWDNLLIYFTQVTMSFIIYTIKTK